MCLGNRAEASASYINAQLSALWSNARRCAEKHLTNGQRPEVSAVEYGTCLYEHYGAGKQSRFHAKKEELGFYAKFNAPRVEFVCNHEVIMFFEVTEGHLKVASEKINGKIEPEITHKLQPSTVAVRLAFGIESIENLVCKAIGNMSNYTMNLLVLLIDSFELCIEHSKVPSITALDKSEHSYFLKQRIIASLSSHLRSYLYLIKRAGHHVLHCLPDFDNLTATSAHIDYSVISKTTLSVQEIYGIEVAKVNEYLRGMWLQNATYVSERGMECGDADLIKRALLSQHKVTWDGIGEEVDIHMFFGPMRIQPLCKREVILYLDIPQIHFHHDRHTYKFTNTKVALMVNIVFEKLEGECIKRVKLDLSSARVCEHYCSLNWDIKETSILVKLQRTLITYITKRYITLIRESHYECIYHHDIRVVVKTRDGNEVDEDDYWRYLFGDFGHDETMYGCWCENKGVCGHGDEKTAVGGIHIRWKELERRRITHTHLTQFDSITAITQRSINMYFYQLWELAKLKVKDLGACKTWESLAIEAKTCLSEYAVVKKEHGDEVFFWANFGAIKIELPTEQGSDHVMVYLTLQDGHLKVLEKKGKVLPGGEEHPIRNWRVAFRVQLKLVTCEESTYKVSDSLLKSYKRNSHGGFKQLVLDFSTAKIIYSQSDLPGLLDTTDTILILKKYQALKYYLTEQYFDALTRAGFHVLHTLPLGASAHSQHLHNKYIGFQIVPFAVGHSTSTWECAFGKTTYLSDRNMIVFVATQERALPHVILERGIPWVCGFGRDVPDGTICLTRKTFLEGRLLKLLERVNRHTTIVPAFTGVDNGRWVVQLTTWDKHHMKGRHPAAWRVVKGAQEGKLAFEHRNREEWKYEHEGDEAPADGAYEVKCNTHNKFTIPTGANEGAATFSLSGRVELAMGYTGVGTSWSAHATVNWHAVIGLVTDPDHGIKVHISHAQVKPVFEKPVYHGAQAQSTFKDAYRQLEEQLTHVIDLSDVMTELKEEFEGVWGGVCIGNRETMVMCPVFNTKGDLLLEVRLRKAIFEPPALSARIEQAATMTPEDKNGGWFRPLLHKVSDYVIGSDHSSHTKAAVNGSAKTNGSAQSNGHTQLNGSIKTDVVVNGTNGHANGIATSPLTPLPTYEPAGASLHATAIKRSASQTSVSKSTTLVTEVDVVEVTKQIV